MPTLSATTLVPTFAEAVPANARIDAETAIAAMPAAIPFFLEIFMLITSFLPGEAACRDWIGLSNCALSGRKATTDWD